MKALYVKAEDIDLRIREIVKILQDLPIELNALRELRRGALILDDRQPAEGPIAAEREKSQESS